MCSTCNDRSKQEALRYTSAAHAYWIVESLIDVSLNCEEEVVGKEQLLESKKNKKTSKLDKDIKALRSQIESLKSLMKNAFHRLSTNSKQQLAIYRYVILSVFVHRYRDIKPVIRKLSLQSLGGWMKSYPAYFVKDDFLKYMGWCLNDEVKLIRILGIHQNVLP